MARPGASTRTSPSFNSFVAAAAGKNRLSQAATPQIPARRKPLKFIVFLIYLPPQRALLHTSVTGLQYECGVYGAGLQPLLGDLRLPFWKGFPERTRNGTGTVGSFSRRATSGSRGGHWPFPAASAPQYRYHRHRSLPKDARSGPQTR